MKFKRIRSPIFGLSNIDIDTVHKFLISDMQDDWFQDPLMFGDYIKKLNVNKYYEENIQKNFGKYVGEERESFHVPKSDFTLRYSAETTYYDRIMYFYLVLPLVEIFDRVLSPRVFSYRFASSPSSLFFNSVNQWDKYEGITRFRSQGKMILETDIQNYYENISIDILRNDLESLLKSTNLSASALIEKRYTIDCLTENLRRWSYDSTRGLPQNRDCSAILANIYLAEVDNAMIKKGYDYYRYMDDIRIIVDDKMHGRKAIKDLTYELRIRHLSVNGKKTRWLDHSPAYSGESNKQQFRLNNIDALLQTKKRENVSLAYRQVKSIVQSLIESNKLDGREFRFCVLRLARLARCYDYQVPDKFWDDIKYELTKTLREHPFCTDRIYQFLASISISSTEVDFIKQHLSDEKTSIYEWQNYWLWKLLLVTENRDEQLIQLARKTIVGKSPPDIAGASLYLGFFGNKRDAQILNNVITNNKSNLLKRHIEIATQRSALERDALPSSQSGDLDDNYSDDGSYSILDFVAKPSKISISNILKDIQPYG